MYSVLNKLTHSEHSIGVSYLTVPTWSIDSLRPKTCMLYFCFFFLKQTSLFYAAYALFWAELCLLKSICWSLDLQDLRIRLYLKIEPLKRKLNDNEVIHPKWLVSLQKEEIRIQQNRRGIIMWGPREKAANLEPRRRSQKKSNLLTSSSWAFRIVGR